MVTHFTLYKNKLTSKQKEKTRRLMQVERDIMPEALVRSGQEQPALTTVDGVDPTVWVIDMSDPDQEKVNGLMINASQEWGIFQIINHGIPNEVIMKLQNVGKVFFELPEEEKQVLAKSPGSKEGYETCLQKEMEGKKGWVDYLFHKLWPPPSINYKFWPKKPSSYREANEEYAKQLNRVADKILKSLSLGLGLKEHELKEAMGGENLQYLLKINYYPPCPRPDFALGVMPHTDMSCITILVSSDVQGLQASRDGKWYNVKYIQNALIVHIGDQLEILSNGKYKSVLHRTTVKKEKARMSWPVFLEPPSEFIIGPHPKLVNGENPAKYKTKKFGDYSYCKINKIPQ